MYLYNQIRYTLNAISEPLPEYQATQKKQKVQNVGLHNVLLEL